MTMASLMTPTAIPEPAAFKKFGPIIQKQAAKRNVSTTDFNPEEHLAFEEPEGVITMKDIGYREDIGVSAVAVSQPFRLFTTECVNRFRDEVLSEQVMKNCLFESNIAACQIRGYAEKYAPFTYDAWHNPRTLAIISQIAGVELIPCMNLEIGHINISVKSSVQASEERAAAEREKDSFAEDEGISGCPWEDDKPVVGWHTDSYPFVCVTMLSDCTNMIGGETAIRTANGDIMKIRGPQMGCAVVMQGRYITHQALRALGAQERITMVTSFRPKSPFLPDDSNLATVRGISVLSDLYYEYGEYRLQIVEERIRAQLKELRMRHRAGKKTNTKALKEFLEEQEKFLRHTNAEIVQDEDVIPGHQPELDIPDVSPSLHEEPKLKRMKIV